MPRGPINFIALQYTLKVNIGIRTIKLRQTIEKIFQIPFKAFFILYKGEENLRYDTRENKTKVKCHSISF